MGGPSNSFRIINSISIKPTNYTARVMDSRRGMQKDVMIKNCMKILNKDKKCLYCDSLVFSKDMCRKHYHRLRVYGRIDRIQNVVGLCGAKPIVYQHLLRFGGIREKVLSRDGYKCVMCGMTREEHYKVFNRDLSIDHIDHQGRYSDIQNNEMDNLQTLCLRCHGAKDAIQHGRYSVYLVNLNRERMVNNK